MRSPSKGYDTRADPRKLFQTFEPHVDPEGLITSYLAFEFHRLKLDGTWSLSGERTERLEVLHWYLAAYSRRRKGNLPLSKEQLAFLNAPAPVIGLGPEMSVAALSFTLRDRQPRWADFSDQDFLRQSIFWWCFERAPEFCPGGELVTPAQVAMLTHVGPEDGGGRFGLNYFVRTMIEHDESLPKVNLSRAINRAAILSVLLLRCLDRPYLTQFLPRQSVLDLFGSTSAGRSLFEGVLALAGSSGPNEASELRAEVERQLAAAGYPISKVGYAAAQRSVDIGPCYAAGGTALAPEAGMAVIGPLPATSGLGQATRLSVAVLEALGRAPAVIDFSMDNPAPIGFASKMKVTKWTRPREINLIHLNAESIPLAFAYLETQVYRTSYNIGYFFWELSEIPKCHHLALEMLDEIWVSSEYNREIYAARTSIPVVNVGMAVENLPSAQRVSRGRFGLSDDDFIFLATFDSFSFIERKNPLGVVAAFRQAFPVERGAKVKLLIKTQNRRRVSDRHALEIWRQIDAAMRLDDRIVLVEETLSYAELLGLKLACDAYVSLHRSEGWGFGLIEAMQLGVPVVATAYSGNMEFCREDNCFLVPFKLVAPLPHEYIFVERGSVWAEPSTDVAAAYMAQIFDDRREAAARAARARQTIATEFSLGAIGTRYAARLAEIRSIIDGGR